MALLAAFNAVFSIDGVTGKISVKTGAVIDYETRALYQVRYHVTDGEDDMGVEEDPPKGDISRLLAIAVTNVDEAGVVTITGTVQVGEELTATLTDPDGSVTTEVWKWLKLDGRFDDIDGATDASYTPVGADEGMFLRASVTYTDGFGPGRTASGTNSSPVQAAAVVHTAPAFDADAELHTTVYVSSLNQERHPNRTMSQNSDFVVLPFSTGGTAAVRFEVSRVQVPMAVPANPTVTAEIWGSLGGDPNPNSRLFTLSAPDEIDNDLTTVEEFKATTPVTLTGGGFYYLVLSKPAGSGNFQIPRRKEVGSFTNNGWQLHRPRYDSNSGVDVYTWANAFENHVALMAIDFSEIRSVDENSVSGAVDSPVTATDDDGDTLTYSVAEATGETDATDNLMDFNRDFSVAAANGQISVKSGAMIDFETRPSYTVRFQVSDGEDASGMSDTTVDDTLTLTVNVTNVNEGGTVTITGDDLQVGVEQTATLVDLDGETSLPEWEWARADTAGGTFTPISNTNSVSYTPVGDDVGKFLKASVSYTDKVFGVGQKASETTGNAR